MKRPSLVLSTLVLALTAIGPESTAQPRLPSSAQDKIFPDRKLPVTPGNIKLVQPRHWDFEDGTLQGFTAEDIPGLATGAFRDQPTFGDNVRASRALDTSSVRLPANPCAGLVLDELTTCTFGRGAVFGYLDRLRNDLRRMRADLDAIGGGYWDTPFPIGKQGLYWIGTAEARSSRGRMNPWGSQVGDRVTGRLVSPEIELNHDYFHLLVGGGCTQDVGVYLQRLETRFRSQPVKPIRPGERVPVPQPGGGTPTATREWVTLNDKTGAPIAARGACMENMVRVVFDISHLKGTKARILIEDRATGAFGHINVDDIWLAHKAPLPSSRDRDPVWAVADLHAHLMNEKGYIAYNAAGTTPEARALWGSALGPIENLRVCNDTHTTNDWNYNSHQDEGWGTTYTLCRDMCLNLLDGAGLPEQGESDQISQDGVLGGYHDTHGGFPSFTAWPMWWSATHQQMHWTWVRRAYQGGVRLMIAAVGNSEVISFGLTKEEGRPFTSDQDALAMQIPAIKEFARQNASWAEVAYTPRDARRIINSGKLAIIIGVELDHVIDSCAADVTRQSHHRARSNAEPNVWISNNGYDVDLASSIIGVASLLASSRVQHVTTHPTTCTDAQLEARVDALHRAGVRQILPMHFSDNLLGGYAVTGSLFTASAIFGDPHARPPQLMNQRDLEATFGAAARPFTPVAREAYVGENRDRRERWEAARPIRFKLHDGISVPLWIKLAAGAILDGSLMDPGIGRTILQFLSGQCIEDDGWRIFAAIVTLGATEAACGITTLTNEIVNASRSTMPYEGATDSAAMIPLSLTGALEELTFHVNARGLQPKGRVFLRRMMRLGMLIDIQHSSEMTKRGILTETRAYPVMASHGGIGRDNENMLSGAHLAAIYEPPNGFTGGIVGLGTQSSDGLIDQVRLAAVGSATGTAAARRLQTRGVALGTDINGMDWHAAPRFGKFGYYSEGPEARARRLRDGRIGPKVRYDAYPPETNPLANTRPYCSATQSCASWSTAPTGAALHPHQITSGGRVTRTFDVNYDGLAHYGMLPDFLQELGVLGLTAEERGTLFRSAEGLIKMWEETCWQAYEMASPPRTLAQGCGPADLYR